jgi:hypothetical protein
MKALTAIVKHSTGKPGIPRWVSGRKRRIALRARFYIGIRSGRGKSPEGSIFGVGF